MAAGNMFGAKMALYAGVDVNNYEPVSFQELVENNAKFKAMHPQQTAIRYSFK